MSEEWSLKAGVFLENVMDVLDTNQLEGAEYVRAMFYLSNVCSERAMKAINKLIKEGDNE